MHPGAIWPFPEQDATAQYAYSTVAVCRYGAYDIFRVVEGYAYSS